MSKTKVALLAPVPSVSSPQKSPPLGILHVGRALSEAKARGKSDEEYSVSYFDLRYEDMTPEDFKEHDIIAVSSMTGHQLKGAIWALKEGKKYGKRTILGGIHVTMQPEQCLREDYVDSIVLSEGEWGIIDAIHGGPKQVVHKHLNGTADHVSPVSPETLIHFKRSARTGDTVLMTSRGCPFRCGFSVRHDMLIPTVNRGSAPASNIQVGDILMGWNEQGAFTSETGVVEVQTAWPSTEYTIFVSNLGEGNENLELICSPEHPILTYRGWVEAKDLHVEDGVRAFGIGKWLPVKFIRFGPSSLPHVNIQCYPHPSFIANNIMTHNCYIQQFFERNERGALAWQEVDMDRWRHDVLYLKENAGVRKYEHGDDWIGKWSRAKEIIRFLWDNGIEYRPSIRAHQINDEVAREMAEMGVKHVSIGMETASLRMLKLTQKDILPHHQIECAEALAKYHIHPLLYWILSFPTETKAEMNETLDQIDRMAEIFKKHGTPLTQNAFSYTALPGSPMFDLVDQSVLPKTMEGWSNYSINKTHDTISSNLYWLVGLTFHRAKGDKTARNFPGWKRLLIAPFEMLAVIRWKLRFFKWFRFEMWAIETLMKWASLRYENEVRKGKFKSLKDVEAMDFGVKENHPDIGARGEFLTGEISNGR